MATEESAMERQYNEAERVALVVWWLAHGEGLRTGDVARLTGLSVRRAQALMMMLCRVLPIYRDKEHVWAVVACKEAQTP